MFALMYVKVRIISGEILFQWKLVDNISFSKA